LENKHESTYERAAETQPSKIRHHSPSIAPPPRTHPSAPAAPQRRAATRGAPETSTPASSGSGAAVGGGDRGGRGNEANGTACSFSSRHHQPPPRPRRLTSLYPLAAATKARPMPVLPLVGSTRVVFPRVILPSASATAIMLEPILSLTLQHGCMISSLAATCPTHPAVTLLRYTMGVLPTRSTMPSAMPVTGAGASRLARDWGAEAGPWRGEKRRRQSTAGTSGQPCSPFFASTQQQASARPDELSHCVPSHPTTHLVLGGHTGHGADTALAARNDAAAAASRRRAAATGYNHGCRGSHTVLNRHATTPRRSWRRGTHTWSSGVCCCSRP
jgi:hypothetical protein